jgi:hypothetical protein
MGNVAIVRSDPALNGNRGVIWNRVEADLGLWRFLVDQVHELFEQEKHRRNGPNAGADEDAIKCLLLERCRNRGLSRFTPIDELPPRIVSKVT